jgi:peroxiredoxin
MIELGQLEARHEDFAKRNTRVVAVSLDNVADSTETGKRFPHLHIVSDQKQSLAKAAGLIAPQRSPSDGETLAPTTVLIDRGGVVRWVSRKGTILERPSPAEVLAQVDEHRRGG